MLPDLVEVALYSIHPWVPAAHYPLVSRAICSRGVPYVDCIGHSVVTMQQLLAQC